MKEFKYLHYIALVLKIGISVALPIVGGIYFGAHLDKQLSTGSAFLIACALIGIFTGAYSAYKLLSKVINNNNKRT